MERGSGRKRGMCVLFRSVCESRNTSAWTQWEAILDREVLKKCGLWPLCVFLQALNTI